MTKSISFLAEEVSEQLRVKLVPHERQLEGFLMLLKDISEKFKRCNLRQQLSQVVDLIRLITKGFEKSQVLEDCNGLMDGFRQKVEKMAAMKKRISQGDKACIEVLR